MYILSLRRGFNADHSSSTYEFFALNRLTPEQRAAVQKLTDESPRRHLRFHYMGDWNDIPSDWQDKLLTLGYDILVSESYDWWAVHLSLPHDPALLKRLQPYECESDGNGFDVRLGFLCPAEADSEQVRSAPVGQGPALPLPLGDGFTLSAPEAVHLAITTRCNLACPGCYVPRPEAGPEWTVAELCRLVDQWARMRVFQLAVGGGEPLLYEGLFDVLAYARQQGIVPNLTTNGTLLNADVVRRLEQAGVARVNVSWDGPGGEHRGRRQAVTRALRLLLDSTLRVGVDLLVIPTLLPRLPQVLTRLQTLGVRWVTVLRPKPPAITAGASEAVRLSLRPETSSRSVETLRPRSAAEAWYEANRLRRADLLQLRDVLNAWQGTLQLEVGSALVGLMGDLDPAFLRWRGIYGCAAGRRICTVWPDGRVTPCSFLADLSAGNARQTPFAELWERGENWGLLRDPTARPQGGCTGCLIALQCGGARCVARHERGALLAGDAECPYSFETRMSQRGE